MFRVRLISASLALIATLSTLGADDLLAPHWERITTLRRAADATAIEEYCRQQLERTALTDVERHALTLEWAQTSLEHALERPGVGMLWTTSEQAPMAYAEQSPTNARIGQLWIQSGLAHLAHGDFLSPPAMDAEHDREPAREQLRAAIKRFRQAREWIEVDARTAPRTAPKQQAQSAIARFTVDELRSLDRHAAFVLAESYRRQAETYPAESEDRRLAARQAEELYHSLSELADGAPLTWPSRVRWIGALRLRQDWPAATQAMARCTEAALPPELQCAFHAEAIRLFVAKAAL